MGHLLLDDAKNLGDGRCFLKGGIDPFQSLTVHVGVYIDDAGDHRSSLKIDGLCVWTGQGKHVLIAAHGLNKFTPYGHCLLDGVVGANGKDLARVQDNVGFI